MLSSDTQTNTKPNPFLKKTKTDFNNSKSPKSPKMASRWANLQISEETEEKSNSFFRRQGEDDGVFSSNRNQTDFRSHGKKFMRYTKPRPPTPPPVFDMKKAEEAEEFPALC